jgi:hypothetical protein
MIPIALNLDKPHYLFVTARLRGCQFQFRGRLKEPSDGTALLERCSSVFGIGVGIGIETIERDFHSTLQEVVVYDLLFFRFGEFHYFQSRRGA